MAVTKSYEFIRFGAMAVTNPCEFIGFGAMAVTKPYEFIGFGAIRRAPGGFSRVPGGSRMRSESLEAGFRSPHSSARVLI